MAEFKVNKFNYLPDTARRAFYDTVMKIQKNQTTYTYDDMRYVRDPRRGHDVVVRGGMVYTIARQGSVSIPPGSMVVGEYISTPIREDEVVENPTFEGGETLSDDLVFETPRKGKIEVDKHGRFLW